MTVSFQSYCYVDYANLGQVFGDRICYLRSSDIENKNWHRLLWSVPDEFFFQFYRGNGVRIRDKSSNRKGKIERIFLPVFIDILHFLWFNRNPICRHLTDHFDAAKHAFDEDRSLYKRYKFWGKRLRPESIRIDVLTEKVEKEPNLLFKRQRNVWGNYSSDRKRGENTLKV